MGIGTKHKAWILATALLSMGMLAGCSGGDQAASDSAATTGKSAGDAAAKADKPSTKAATIGLLLPDNVTERYASADKPFFEERVKQLCSNCKVLYANAAQDAAKQQQQAESMLTQDVSVLVLDPFDGKAAAAIVNRAKQKGVPVISYDRLINSPHVAYYISFDNVKVGEMQATALINKMKQLGLPDNAGIIMVNGSPTDPNAAQFKQGAHNVLDKSKLTILAEYNTPGWVPSKTQQWVAGQVSRLGDKIKGVYVANDDNAGAAIAALKAGGVNPLPPVTGMDAALSGIQRILSGDQFMTVYKAFKPEAYKAAELAVALSQGKKPEAPASAKTADGADVPAFLLKPVVVTTDNIASTVIKGGLYTVDQICTDAYAAACKKYGIE